MNERKFLKKLNSETNKDGKVTFEIVKQLLSEGQALAVKRKFNLLSVFFRKKSAGEIIQDNFETILDRTTYSELNKLLKSLMENWQTSEIIKEKFDAIIKRFNSIKDNEEEYCEAIISGHEKAKFYDNCKKTFTYADDLIIAHIDAIIKWEVTIEELQELKLSEEANEKLNTKLETQKQEIAREIIGSIFIALDKESEKEIQRSETEKQQLITDYLPTVMRLIEELLVDQNARMVDIERIGSGGYSKVYQIGEKVLKIGKPRETYKIPNHPRILQPLTRTNLIDERDNNKIFGCIEVSDRVDLLCSSKEQEQELADNEEAVEKLYQIYKELRDDGIIWTDVRFANVGKLRKRNVPELDGEEMDVDPEAVGMDKSVKGKVLEVGEWVIIDTDYIWREEDNKSMAYSKKSYFKEFERRWYQERQGKIGEKFKRKENDREQEGCTRRYELGSEKKKEEEER